MSRAWCALLTAALFGACHPRAPATIPCQPLGDWAVTWAPLEGDAELRSLRREFTMHVDATDAVADRWMDQIAASTDQAHVEVDRARCVATLDLATEFAFADDAGDRREGVQLQLDLRGDGGDARGTLHLEEVGDDPEDRHVPVGGRVRRIVDE